MSTYIIQDGDGNEVNRIQATFEFVEEHYSGRYSTPEPEALTDEESAIALATEARSWRNSELADTDRAAEIPDWPNRENILLYRTALRSWPADADNFPDTKPELSTD